MNTKLRQNPLNVFGDKQAHTHTHDLPNMTFSVCILCNKSKQVKTVFGW